MPPTKRVARRAPAPDLEEQDEVVAAPAPPRMKAADNGDTDSNIRSGWSAGEQTMASTSSFAQTLKLDEKTQVIKFLEDQPYASYTRHWIERSGPTGKQLRSYVCLKTFNVDCPVCDAGDRAQAVSAFNVALIGDDGVATLKSWDCGPKLFNALKAHANDPKVAPLTRGYFLVGRSGKKGSVNYTINPIKPSSLEEDYDIEPPDKATLDRLGLYDKKIIERPKLKDMEEVAVEIADEY
jgi:hypothetical protein